MDNWLSVVVILVDVDVGGVIVMVTLRVVVLMVMVVFRVMLFLNVRIRVIVSCKTRVIMQAFYRLPRSKSRLYREPASSLLLVLT